MKKLIIKTSILIPWLKAKIELHSDYVDEKEFQKREWKLADYCKYCTDFLIKREDGEDDFPCVKCGIQNALRENGETTNEIFSFNREKISK
jgi:hypothetical protein